MKEFKRIQMKALHALIAASVAFFVVANLDAQNVGIGTATPASNATVSGNSSIGSAYSATAAPVNGLIVEGNTGIGTSTPNATAKLHVALGTSTTDGLLVTGTYDVSSTVPNLGAGSRLMWYPGKSAFRAGRSLGTEWDNASVGRVSFASGYNTTATGTFSTAMGASTTASGQGSTALGQSSVASGLASSAIGSVAQATGSGAAAIGSSVTASGDRSVAMNLWTRAEAYATTALGRYNVGGGTAGSWVSTDPLFEIGIGTGVGTEANAMTVLKDGRTGIGTATPSEELEVYSTGVTMSRITSTSSTTGLQLFHPGNGNVDWSIVSGFSGSNMQVISSTNDFAGGTVRLRLDDDGDVIMAQTGGNVGIGTGTPSATLHVSGTFRLDNSAVTGEVLQATDNLGNTAWVDPATFAWQTTGNAGTTAGTHFVGTTDAQDLDIRTNNVIRTRITQKGQIETLNTGRSVFIGEEAGDNDDLVTNYNVFIGYQSGRDNNDGRYNTAVGSYSQRASTGADYNVSFGALSLLNNTNASGNVAVGRSALYTQSYAGAGAYNSYNTAVGYYALHSNQPTATTNGYQNTGLGAFALRQNTYGSRNTASGYYALYSNTNANNNVAVGHSALYTQSYNNGGTSWDSDNTAVGANAMYSNQPTINTTYGSRNVAVGTNAMYASATAWSCTAVGVEAAYNGATNSAAVGYRALYSGGSSCVAVGREALEANTAAWNTAVGGWAMTSNTTGSYSTAVGYHALSDNLTGHYNTAVGFRALESNTTGHYNTAVGQGSFDSNTDGDYNTAVGQSSLGNSTTGNRNTAIGQGTLASGDGSYNTAIGQSAGNNAATEGTSLGYDATTGTFTNATAVGARAYAGASNTLVLGSVNGVNGATASVNVGIGITTPAYTLQTSAGGTVSVNDGYLRQVRALYLQDWDDNTGGVDDKYRLLARDGAWQFYNGGVVVGNYGNGTWTDLANGRLIVEDRIGVGVTAPWQDLHLHGGGSVNYLYVTNSTTGSGGNAGLLIGEDGVNSFIWNYANGELYFGTNDQPYMAIEANGQVGIGTQNPAYQLQLTQNSAAKPTSSAWTVASDARLKTNVRDYTDGLGAIERIQPVWFTYSGEAGMPQEEGIGVIAQDLEEVAPYMVGTWESEDVEGCTTEYLGVDNGAMTYMLINAVKEQQKMIESLQIRIEELESR